MLPVAVVNKIRYYKNTSRLKFLSILHMKNITRDDFYSLDVDPGLPGGLTYIGPSCERSRVKRAAFVDRKKSRIE